MDPFADLLDEFIPEWGAKSIKGRPEKKEQTPQVANKTMSDALHAIEEQLPTEIWRNIAEFLSLRTLLRCLQVSRCFEATFGPCTVSKAQWLAKHFPLHGVYAKIKKKPTHALCDFNDPHPDYALILVIVQHLNDPKSGFFYWRDELTGGCSRGRSVSNDRMVGTWTSEAVDKNSLRVKFKGHHSQWDYFIATIDFGDTQCGREELGYDVGVFEAIVNPHKKAKDTEYFQMKKMCDQSSSFCRDKITSFKPFERGSRFTYGRQKKEYILDNFPASLSPITEDHYDRVWAIFTSMVNMNLKNVAHEYIRVNRK